MNAAITLATLSTVPIGDIAALPNEQLVNLCNEADEQIRKAKLIKEWLDGAINLKYQHQAEQQRQQQDKPFGTIRIEDGSFVVICDVPKKAEWDQLELAKIAHAIHEAGDDPSEYVEVSYRVAERKYTAWPEHIRKSFDKARTLKAGKPTYVIKPIDESKGGQP